MAIDDPMSNVLVQGFMSKRTGEVTNRLTIRYGRKSLGYKVPFCPFCGALQPGFVRHSESEE